MTQETRTVATGIHFGEAPRWRGDTLWFSDTIGRRVCTTNLEGHFKEVVRLEDEHPCGLGFLPDGRLLIVSTGTRRLLSFNGEDLSVFSDFSDLVSAPCNDMVTDATGRSYVGNMGFNWAAGEERKPGSIILVDADGVARIVAEGLSFPNGMVITADGKTLIVAESFKPGLTAFTIETDGTLSNQRVFADFESDSPDGICLDDSGAVWTASPPTQSVMRVLEGGEITDRITIDKSAMACTLGGPDRRTLFIMRLEHSRDMKKAREEASATVEAIEVDVAGGDSP